VSRHLELVWARRYVELDRREPSARKLAVHRQTPRELAGSVLRHPGRWSDGEDESIAVHIVTERVDEAVPELTCRERRVAQAQVDVFGEPRRVAEADFHGHAALQHPTPRLGTQQARDESLEDHAAA